MSVGDSCNLCKQVAHWFIPKREAVTQPVGQPPLKRVRLDTVPEQATNNEEITNQVKKFAQKTLVKMCELSYDAEGSLTTKLMTPPPSNTQWFKNIDDQLTTHKVTKLQFFHGTTQETAELIKEEGFDPLLAPIKSLDAGTGSYFTSQRNLALGYAKDKPEGVIEVKVKPRLKIALLDDNARKVIIRLGMIVGDYVKANESTFLKEMKKIGEKETHPLKVELTNLFIREAFGRWGYRGFYTDWSDAARGSYLSLLFPDKDITQIS